MPNLYKALLLGTYRALSPLQYQAIFDCKFVAVWSAPGRCDALFAVVLFHFSPVAVLPGGPPRADRAVGVAAGESFSFWGATARNCLP